MSNTFSSTRKIVAVHLNYRSRAQQRGRIPAFPSYFFKPLSSIAGSGDHLERPAGTELLAFEGEIALVIGTRARHVSPDEGWNYVSGITAANDFGIYDLRAADKGSNVRSKGGDGFTPLGPDVIEASGVDPTTVRVRTWVNDVLVQSDSRATLLFPFGQLIADLSQHMTLEPGDVVLTGTPAGSSVVGVGDTVQVEVDVPDGPSSGRLITHIPQGSSPFGDFGDRPKVDDNQRIEAWGDAQTAGLPVATRSVLTPEIREKIAQVAVATLSVQLRKRGFTDIFIEGVFPGRPGTKMVGVARTLRFIAFRPDLFASHGGGFNAQKRAFDAVESGDVLVIEARGERGTGTVGDVLALRAQVRGAAGIVTDGGIRDYDVVSALDIPTFSQGPHPSVLGRRHVPWETDVTISCGGAAVQPGDIIVGDTDGVIVIPPNLLHDVVEEAHAQELEDAWIAQQVAKGEKVDGLFPMNGEWRARYSAETSS